MKHGVFQRAPATGATPPTLATSLPAASAPSEPAGSDAGTTLVSVVLPVFNEAAVLEELAGAVAVACRQAGCLHEIIFVDDGSSDSGPQVMHRLAAADGRVRVLRLSRNFGHQAAVLAGLSHARGEAIVVMDSDLQDDPAAIAAFVQRWREGHDVVYAVRIGRKENPLKRLLFFAFYRLLNAVSAAPIPMDAGNFSLLDRRVARRIVSLGECDRYFPGLRSWVGFRQAGVIVERGRRYDGKARVSLLGLFRLAKTALFSFSRAPLSMFYAISAASLSLCAACIIFTLYHKLFTGQAIPGWTSITIVASLLGALNASGIGILGEYVVRIYDQVRGRPPYVVAEEVNFDAADEAAPEERILADVRQLQLPGAPLAADGHTARGGRFGG